MLPFPVQKHVAGQKLENIPCVSQPTDRALAAMMVCRSARSPVLSAANCMPAINFLPQYSRGVCVTFSFP